MNKIKFFKLFILLFLFSNIIFSFKIYDSKTDDEEKYFSIEKSNFYIEIENSNFPVTFKYKINNISYSKEFFSYEFCDSKPCIKFLINDFFINNNNSFLIPNELDINYEKDSKIIFFDIKKPKVKLLNSKINKEKKNILFNFEFIDDETKIKKISIYLKKNLSIKLKSYNKNNIEKNFLYKIKKDEFGKNIFLFEVFDSSNNKLLVTENVDIPDLYKPSFFINKITKEDKIKLDLTLIDNINLKQIKIFAENETITEDLSLKLEKKSFTFDNLSLKKINFELIDNSDNKLSSEIFFEDIQNTIIPDNVLENTTLKIKSNSKNCILTKLDDRKIEKNFTKLNVSLFEITLPKHIKEDSEIEFYCEDDIFKIYHTKKIIIDKTLDKKIKFYVSLNENKTWAKLSWKKYEDRENLNYDLYKNDKLIKSFSNETIYFDKDLEKNKIYKYKLVVLENKIPIFTSDIKSLSTENLNKKDEIIVDEKSESIKPEENNFILFFFIFIFLFSIITYLLYTNKNFNIKNIKKFFNMKNIKKSLNIKNIKKFFNIKNINFEKFKFKKKEKETQKNTDDHLNDVIKNKLNKK